MTNDAQPVIVGGGITGLLLALHLKRYGLPVVVFDRGPDPRRGESVAGRSINLALAARGRAALSAAGLDALIMAQTTAMFGRMLHAPSGEQRFQRYSADGQSAIYSIERHGLTVTLVDACVAAGVDLRFDSRCVGVSPAERTVHVETPAGTVNVNYDPLIGADGAGSIVRRDTAFAASFGATEELLDHGYKELSIPATAYGWFRLDPHALHIWPRSAHMLIALPNRNGDFTATLFLANDAQPGFNALTSDADVNAFFASHYPNAGALIPALVDEFSRNPIGVMGTVRCERWHINGDVVLIGDAAHAIVPFHGQGMNAALEDCRVFAALLNKIGPDWAQLFATFEHERRRHTDAIATMALENYAEMRDTVRDAAFHLRKAVAFALEQALPDRFVTQYALVMFRDDIGYADAQQRGAIQDRLLHELCADAETLDDIDMDGAITAAKARLAPL